MKPTEMLAEVLRRGELTVRERESFEDMFDRINRYGRCSDRQKAWIEKVYYDQKLDRQAPAQRRRVIIPNWQRSDDTGVRNVVPPRPVATAKPVDPSQGQPVGSRQVLVKNRGKTGTFLATPMAASQKAHQVGYINYPGVQREERVTSLLMFEEMCPRIKPGSNQHRRVADFFARGGVVLKVKPLATACVA